MTQEPLYPEGHPKRIEQDSQRNNGHVWFGYGFLKAAVKNLLWKNNCGKSDVKKM